MTPTQRSRDRRTILTPVVALALTAALAGCTGTGAGHPSSSTGQTTPSTSPSSPQGGSAPGGDEGDQGTPGGPDADDDSGSDTGSDGADADDSGGHDADDGSGGDSDSDDTGSDNSSGGASGIDGWTLAQKAGQLIMVGVPVAGDREASYQAVTQEHVGNIFLAGRTKAGVQRVRNLVDAYTKVVGSKTTHGTPMFVATDQEGGEVQVLRGPGFSDIPGAMSQAERSPATLKKQARTWGQELSHAGINLNLAPVMDVVTNATTAKTNAPIGAFHRNYGYGPTSTYRHADAFSNGMRAAGVDVSIKHFPGLGRVAGNTDTTKHVVDDVTTADSADPQMTSFRHGIKNGAPFVMMSSAVYSRIDDSGPAAFSHKIVTHLLRKKLGFDGVVISDSFAGAKAVTPWSPAKRAVKFVKAGGDMILLSGDATLARPMIRALVKRAKKNPGFAKKLDAATERVLRAKRDLAG